MLAAFSSSPSTTTLLWGSPSHTSLLQPHLLLRFPYIPLRLLSDSRESIRHVPPRFVVLFPSKSPCGGCSSSL